jgi:hypothetical protein
VGTYFQLQQRLNLIGISSAQPYVSSLFLESVFLHIQCFCVRRLDFTIIYDVKCRKRRLMVVLMLGDGF